MRFLPLLMCLICVPFFTAHAAAIGAAQACYNPSDTNIFAKDYFVQVANCKETNRQNMFQAIGAMTRGNPAQTQAMLGMLNVENSCGSEQSHKASCDGTYKVSAPCSGCTAYGAAQIVDKTWANLVSGSNKQYLINQLGGCGATVSANSLVSPRVTPDRDIRQQFLQFRESLCGIRRPSPTDKKHWGSMVGVSLLLAKAHNLSANNHSRNPAISNALNGAGLDTTGVATYAVHNLGSGGGAQFLNALARDPNASMLTVLPLKDLKNNWGLYCTSSSCSQPLTIKQAAERMHNKLYSDSCVRDGLAALGMGAPQFGLVNFDGVMPDNTNTITAISGDIAALEQAQSAGGAVNENGKASGYCSSSVNAKKPDAMEACPE